MDLPRLLMRGALVVVACALVAATLLGLWRARQDMRDELAAATALAQLNALLLDAPGRADADLLAGLRALQAGNALRHLQVRLLAADGRVLLQPEGGPADSALLRALVALNDRVFAPPPSQRLSVPLARPDGSRWTLQWIASHEGEQREALAQMVDDLATLAACAIAVLLVMRWNIRRSFRSLAPLLVAIGKVEQQDLGAMRALPAMPIRELDLIAAALRHLAEALEQAEARRRVLATQMLTLQEDERSRIARELHDELGQHLTALRVDAAWLQRRLADEPEMAAVAAGMGEQCARIQHEVRGLLTRLRPLGGDADSGTGAARVQRLHALLQSLVQGWCESKGATRYTLDFRLDGVDDDALLPLDRLLTVYRISQEALTNIARHAQASEATLAVTLQATPDEDGAAQGQLHWRVQDDGCGVDVASAWHRGNGLAGIQERVWAAGGELQLVSGATDGAAARGLLLEARLPFTLGAAERADEPDGARR